MNETMTTTNNGLYWDQYQGGATTGLTGNCIQYWPVQYPTGYPIYIHTTSTPTECSGEVHIFPCQKCGECKCGKARMTARGKR